MTKLKRMQQDNEWIEGATFLFGSKPSAKDKTKESRNARRESMIVHQATKKSKYGRKSLAVNGLDLMSNLITSSPISRRTRRQSMAVLANKPLLKSVAFSPKTKLQKPPIFQKISKEEKTRKVNSDPIITKKTVSKSPLKLRAVLVKLPRSGSTSNKLNEHTDDANHMEKEKNENTGIKLQRTAGSTQLGLKKIEGKQKALMMVKKPVKRLTSKATTPFKPPINNSCRLTRSAKKKVKIVAASPVLSNGSFRKTPVIEKKQTTARKLNSTSYLASQNLSIDLPKVVSIARQKYNKATPFTPKPEEPLKLIRQNMKKKIADDIKSAKNFGDSSFLTIKKTPHKFVETKVVVLPSTPVSASNLPPTPVSSKKSILRSVRKRDSVRIESKISSENGDCEMTSSILLEKPWSSTPVRKRTYEAESPYPDSNLINISELTHNSRDTDITDSFSESVANGNNNEEEEVEELEPGVHLETGKRFCSIM